MGALRYTITKPIKRQQTGKAGSKPKYIPRKTKMKKIITLCFCTLLALLSLQAFCGELKVVRYSDSALERALSDNLPVALWFTDDDDYESRLLEEDILNNGQFVAAVEDMIWLKVDMTGPANRIRWSRLCDDFNVTRVPSVVYLDTDGREYS